MKVLLIVLLILVLLGMLKVGVHFVWDGEAKLQLLLWKFRISLPGKKKTGQDAPESAAVSQTMDTVQQKSAGLKGLLKACLAHWQEILELVGRAFRMPRIDVLTLHATAGGPDAAACALNYGKLWAAAGGVLPVLENTFCIGKREIEIRCDYAQRENSYYARVDITVRIYKLLILAFLGMKLLVQLHNESKLTQKAVQIS